MDAQLTVDYMDFKFLTTKYIMRSGVFPVLLKLVQFF
jgi:hypothetical protein